MTTFVLVHGAWTGAYGFRHVRKLLQAQEHEVFTPSLTGIGDRAHLASPQVTLRTHVDDVANLVLYEDLSRIVLLGFSYGGFVVSGALEHIADRVEHLVFLDALVPEFSGQSVLALVRGTDHRAQVQLNQPWMLPPPDRGFDSPDEGRWIRERRTGQPAATFADPVHLSRPLEDYPFSRTYIAATASPPGDPGLDAIGRCAARFRSSKAWHYAEIPTGHMVASNRPEEVTRILLERVAGN